MVLEQGCPYANRKKHSNTNANRQEEENDIEIERIHFIKINSKWIIHFNIQHKTNKKT